MPESNYPVEIVNAVAVGSALAAKIGLDLEDDKAVQVFVESVTEAPVQQVTEGEVLLDVSSRTPRSFLSETLAYRPTWFLLGLICADLCFLVSR